MNTYEHYPLANLTPRETDVLGLLAQGLSNAQIADQLVIAESTTKWYVHQLFGKLGAQRRTEAVMIARHIGLLDAKPAPPPTGTNRHNLPYQTTPIIGRAQDLARLDEYLKQRHRLITITGTGGVGKTRLALEAAWRHVPQFDHGTYVIQLAPLTAPDDILLALAHALEFSFHGTAELKTQLLNYLRHKESLLLFDNFEHLLSGAEVISDILSVAPSIQIVCTSRQPLGLRGEIIYALEGLTYPDRLTEAGLDFAAVKLFSERALLADPRFKLTEQNLQQAARVCQILEGLPLAIELVATWVPSLPLEAIVAEIKRGLDVLAADVRDLPLRQRSIRAVFEHSWQLLEAAEQDVLCRLAVFRGGFSLEAASVVAGASPRIIASLLSKSLLHRDRQTNRYSLHELVRMFAQEKLDAKDSAANEVADQHCAYFLNKTSVWGQALMGAGQTAALAAIDVELENIAVAAGHARHFRQVDRLGQWCALWFFYEIKGYVEKGKRQFELAVQSLEDSDANGPVLGKALTALGVFHLRLGEFAAARRTSERARGLFEESGGDAIESIASMTIGNVCSYTEGPEPAAPLYTQALAIAEAYGDEWYVGAALALLGRIEKTRGDFEQADTYIRRAIAIHQQLNEKWGLAFDHYGLGNLLADQGNLQGAILHYQTSLEMAHAIGFHPGVANAHEKLGAIYVKQGDFNRARTAFERSLDIYLDLGNQEDIPLLLVGLGEVHCATGDHHRALDYFRDGATTALEGNNQSALLEVLYRAGKALAQTQLPFDVQWLIIALQVIVDHPVTDQATAQEAQHFLADLTAGLSADELQSLRATRQTVDLRTVIENLLPAL